MDLEQLTTTWVPTWVMVLVVSVLTVSLLVGVPLARSAGLRRGRRVAHPDAYATRTEKAKDTGLFLAALIPTLLVWLAVMGVSFIGLTGFAADVMGWDHWTNVLVPLSLDGISISFGAWAFVAVKRGRHPGRAYKIVLAAATVSATLNFVHGRDKWSIWAGLYLAFLSFAGMAMFHELLDQFMAGYDDEVALKTRYPRFGQRWLYAPLSSFAARRAWIVDPPEDGVRPSIRNALSHLEDMREAARLRKLGRAELVREEAQARIVEVRARNEVRAARAAGRTGLLLGAGHRQVDQVPAEVREDLAEPQPQPQASAGVPAQPASVEAPLPPADEPEAVSAVGVAAVPVASVEAQTPARADADPVSTALASLREQSWPDQTRTPINSPRREEPRRDVQADPVRRDVQADPVRRDVQADPVRRDSMPTSGTSALVPDQRPVPQREVQPAPPAPVPAGSESVRARVPRILGERVFLGDQLQPRELTDLVMRELGAQGANRDSVARYVNNWIRQVNEGKVQLTARRLQLVREEQS